MSLIIGSAQFGLDYGISNKNGVVAVSEIKKIINLAESNHINEIDSAVNYGSSQAAIGSINSSLIVSSKLPAIDLDGDNVEQNITEIITTSLKTLNRANLKNLYLHNPNQLFEPNGALLYNCLKKLQADKLIKGIGMSVYEPDELEKLMQYFDFDTVQIPFSLVDQRFASNNLLERLVMKNVEINCRSIFLQGLLLMPYKKIPEKFKKWESLFRVWGEWLYENKIDPAHACIAGVKQNQQIHNIVIGVESADQLNQAIKFHNMPDNLVTNFPDISSNDTNLVNPSKWSQ
jgi:aryl-alcohol dehydrogenase-like predicted oxidoreductase